MQAIAELVKSLRADAVHLNTTTRPAMAGVKMPPAPEAWLHKLAANFSPAAEIPDFMHRTRPPGAMSDEALLKFLARHPIALEALADSSEADVVQLERRLAPLVAAGKLVIEGHHGIRMVRARGA